MTKFLWVVYRHRVTTWGLSTWWQYLLAPRRDTMIPWYTVIRCRLDAHHGRGAGPCWFTMTGLEPDMHCQQFGDDLG